MEDFKKFKLRQVSHCQSLKRVIGSSIVMRCAIWYHLCNLQNVKNTNGGVLLLACSFTKNYTLPWVFFTFFKLYKWYKIA